MQHLRKVGFVAALAATFVMGGFILPDRATLAGPNLFRDVVTLVSTRYIDPLDMADVYERAAEGLVLSLGDPYAELYSPEELEEFTTMYEGHYAGVGMLIQSEQGGPVVMRVFPNTPAERNGLRMGDRLVTIDGESVEGWPVERVANALKGEPGSLVDVQFRRHGLTTVFTARITRAVVRIPAVPFTTVVKDDIGYIPLLQFNETATEEVVAALDELAARGVAGLVLDLRGNGGGMLDQAVRVAGLFLPTGSSVARQWERGSEDIRYLNELSPMAPELPLVVLVDGASASAAEIVAGALQDHDRAVVVGGTSFGKGLVQTAYRIDGGYVLKMTTGKWYTPSGRSIHRERTLVRGRLVEVDDSVHFAAGRDERPTYRSAAGRLVYGGGGITPDLEVKPEPLSQAEERLVTEMILPHGPEFFIVAFDYAAELGDSVDRDFAIAPEWRAELYRRLLERGVTVDPETYAAGASFIDRELTRRIGNLAFGDAYAMVREIDHDPALLRAVDIIRQGAPRQADLFGYVTQIREGR
jgi:carboxyl-terminal processing protease